MLKWAEERKDKLEKLYSDSNLSIKPDLEFINKLLIDVRAEFYNRKVISV